MAIALTINFIGDGLRDAFDPRQRNFNPKRARETGAGQLPPRHRRRRSDPRALTPSTGPRSRRSVPRPSRAGPVRGGW
ncbi:hypothetical protein QJS66_21905 [Kocuria rhizophila]|nr:hypothetical protein QJS66_21905 [Kocuria rhizophila]